MIKAKAIVAKPLGIMTELNICKLYPEVWVLYSITWIMRITSSVLGANVGFTVARTAVVHD